MILAIAVVAAVGVAVFWFSSPPETIDVTGHPVAPIPPGTVIADAAPDGWSHLILKSQPRFSEESAAEVSQATRDMIGLLFTAIVADVERKGFRRFVLAKVAAGVGTEVNGQDTIISSESQAELGAELGLIQQMVLSGGEKHVRKMVCVARSSTMAVLDAPNLLCLDEKHTEAVIRYALLVDRRSGRLNTIAWAIKKDNQSNLATMIGPAQWLPGDYVEDCLLHVDHGGYILGIPTSAAFARCQIPQGRRTLEFPPELAALATATEWDQEAARTLEKQLRKLL